VCGPGTANPEGLGDLFQDKEQAEDGAQRHFGGRGLIKIAAQSAAERLDTSGIPMERLARVRFFHFALFAEGLAEEDGGGRIAVGMVEMYIPTSYHINMTCQDTNNIT